MFIIWNLRVLTDKGSLLMRGKSTWGLREGSATKFSQSSQDVYINIWFLTEVNCLYSLLKDHKNGRTLACITLLVFFPSRISFAILVNGPFAKIVIFNPGSSDFTTDSNTSNARGCLSSGWSVFRGAPNFTEFSAVYLVLLYGSYIRNILIV